MTTTTASPQHRHRRRAHTETARHGDTKESAAERPSATTHGARRARARGRARRDMALDRRASPCDGRTDDAAHQVSRRLTQIQADDDDDDADADADDGRTGDVGRRHILLLGSSRFESS